MRMLYTKLSRISSRIKAYLVFVLLTDREILRLRVELDRQQNLLDAFKKTEVF